MKQQFFAISIVGLGALLLATQHAFGQTTVACGDHDAIASELAQRWGEVVQSMGLTAQGALVETFAAPDTGTWTITVTLPSGETCVIAAGEALESRAGTTPGNDA